MNYMNIKYFRSAASVVALLFASNLVLAASQTRSEIPNHAVILQYHHVSDTTPASTSISVERFKQHMDYLASAGYQIKSLSEVVTALRAKTSASAENALPDKTVVITFDDAYLSIYQNAYPLLKERNWPFTVFVNSAKTHSNPRLYLNWDQLREMANNGAIIANHSPDHGHLLRRTDTSENVNGGEGETAVTETAVAETRSQWLARIERDVISMQAEIVKETGQDERYFAYPYGEADADLRNMLTKLGYVGLGQHSGPIGEYSDFSFLPRFPMSGVYSGLKPMRTKLRTLPFPIIEQELHKPLLANSVERPELTLKLLSGNYRLGELACYGSERGRISAVTGPKPTAAELDAGQNYRQIQVHSEQPIILGRSRYNCTAPHVRQGRYYWFSAYWYRKGAGESWIAE